MTRGAASALDAQTSVALAKAVRQRRKSLGLTQHDLARASGCGLAFIYHLERGKPSLRFDKLLSILRALGLEMSLIAREPPQGSPQLRPPPETGTRVANR